MARFSNPCLVEVDPPETSDTEINDESISDPDESPTSPANQDRLRSESGSNVQIRSPDVSVMGFYVFK